MSASEIVDLLVQVRKINNTLVTILSERLAREEKDFLRAWMTGFGGFPISKPIRKYFVKFADINDYIIISSSNGVSTGWLQRTHKLDCLRNGEVVNGTSCKFVNLDEVIGYISIDDVERYGVDPTKSNSSFLEMIAIYLHRRQIESRNIWKLESLWKSYSDTLDQVHALSI